MAKVTTASPVRELFIEELADIHAGASAKPGPGYTTYACCEEGPFGCCDLIPDIIDPKP